MPSQSDNAITFSFDSPNSLPAEADLRAAVNTPDNNDYEAPAPVADKPAVVAAPVVETKPNAETPVESSTQVVSPELKTHKVTVQGQEIEVTEADLLAGHMRHRDYTQKTQQLAEQQRQWEAKEAEYQSTLQAFDNFLADKDALSTYAQKAFGINPTAPALPAPVIENPNAPTLADIAKIAAYNAEMVRRSMAEEYDAKMTAAVQAAQQTVLQAQAATTREKYVNELDTHVFGLLKQYPDLNKFEDITEDLMGDANKRLPKGSSINDAKAQLTAAAERRMAVIQSFATENGKAAAIQAAKLRNNSPEPPGGSPAAQTTQRKFTLNTGDRKDLIASATADVQAFIDANR